MEVERERVDEAKNASWIIRTDKRGSEDIQRRSN
jgi:hypothetical protein